MKRPEPAECLFGLGAAALGAGLLAGSFGIDSGSGYDRIGPRFFPWLVAAGLLLTGGLVVAESVLGGRRQRRDALDRRALGTLFLALTVTVLLLDRLGFIPAAALLFWLVARAFDSPRPWRDALAGIILAAVVYFAFTSGLGLVLPRGPLAGFI